MVNKKQQSLPPSLLLQATLYWVIAVSLAFTMPSTTHAAQATFHLDIHPQAQTGSSALPTTPVQKASAVIDVDQNIPPGAKAGQHDVAVIIGNRNYQRSGVPPIEYAHRDATVMKQYLIKTFGFAEENILDERDASKGVFEMLFGTHNSSRSKLKAYVKADVSRVFIYYVGHGAPDLESGEGFFMPVDADPDYIANTGYSLALFYKNLKTIKAKEIIVVIDACFSGRTQEGLLFNNISPAKLKLTPIRAEFSQGAVLASSSNDQVSTWYPAKQHSLFTYFFLKGLQGEADLDQDRTITVGEMESWLQKKVPFMALRLAGKNQNPQVEGLKNLVLVTLE